MDGGMTPERAAELLAVGKQTSDPAAAEAITELYRALVAEHNAHVADHNALDEAMRQLDAVGLERNRFGAEIDRLLGIIGTIYMVAEYCGPKRKEAPETLRLVPEGGWAA